MQKGVTVAQVFVAGPADVDDERRQLEEVVGELNLMWSQASSIRLELLTWRTHAQPGVGDDAQDVVNRAIGSSYDIFLGVMWSRFGTPTGRAGSGTEEEFNRALERYRANPASVRLMFYFKDEPVAPSQLDVEQFARVVAFKKRLEDEGVLYFTFRKGFDSAVRIHLARQMQDWLASASDDQQARDRDAGSEREGEWRSAADDVAEDDLGVFDCMELFLEQIGTYGAARSRAIDAIFELHQAVIDRGSAHAAADLPAARQALVWMAQLLEAIVTRLRAEMPIIAETFASAIDNLGKTLAMATEMGFGDRINTAALHDGLNTAVDRLGSDYDFLQRFRTTIAGTPRMFSQLNRAKRRTLEAVDEFASACLYQRDTLQQIVDSVGPPSDTA